MPPRYASRHAFCARPSGREFRDSDNFAETTLDRVVIDRLPDIASMTRPAAAPDPSAARPSPASRLRSTPTWRALAWAPAVFLAAVALGAVAGSLLAALGL